MIILALDPATKCGWAHSSGPAGTWDLSTRRDESSGMKLIRFRGKLAEILRDAGAELVVFEAARHAAPKMQGALVVQAELQSVVKTWCEDNALPYRGYSPSEIKKHATGKGNAGKDAMGEAAREKWPGIAGDDNEVDARWLLDLAAKEYATTSPSASASEAPDRPAAEAPSRHERSDECERSSKPASRIRTGSADRTPRVLRGSAAP